MNSIQPLPPEALYHPCDQSLLKFKTTAELEDLAGVIGQPRAMEAIQFGIGIQQGGYNIYALGPAGTGKRSLIQQFFEHRATQEPVPDDWCYVYDFKQTHQPHAIRLPAGQGRLFRQEMENLVTELKSAIATAFESDEYRARRQVIEEEFKERQEKAFEAIQQQAKERDLMVIRTPAGLMFAPTRDGEVMPPEEFRKLPEEEQKRVQANVEALQEAFASTLEELPRWQKEMRVRLKELHDEITGIAVKGLIDELRAKFADQPAVLAYLDEVQQDVIENAQGFLEDEARPTSAEEMLAPPTMRAAGSEALLRRYRVNLLIDHGDSQGAPVVYEDNPTYQNLIGRVEHTAQMGALVTDFNLIKPGALHKANGGYLILDARKVLTQAYAWEGLKRALEARQIRIESLGQMLSLVSTVSLEPEPIPLNVKVALLGDRILYYLLCQLEPDFNELFKVAADFDEAMDLNEANLQLYAQLIATLTRRYSLQPFARQAVARVIEHSARLAGDSQKLSTQMNNIVNLLQEADYWAREAGEETVSAASVQKAIDAHVYRLDRLRERMQEQILRGTILIDTEGEKVGQINGLSVIELGEFAFGRPSRITARIRLGKGEVVDIEREVELGGPIHSKGVLILSGFLGARYGQERPLSLAASLVFEQSYSGVEGDSASSAELYALLSAIGEVPIKQSLAVTGSVNQYGQVQAIGGVNEKIEGFFDVCKARGLTGDQGVLIPASNVPHLMLRQDVVAAVEKGQFHIYPIETIDQGIEILTGMPAGEPDEDGRYPDDSVNGRVTSRLVELAEKQKPEKDQEQGSA